MARRRYDSVAFTEGIRRDRRRGLLLGFIGAGITIGLVALYSLSVEESEIPGVPADPTPMPQARDAALPSPVHPAPELGPSRAAPPKTAVVDITFVKTAPLWVDDESVGKVKTHRVELGSGKHEVRAKVGAKTITQRFHVAAGERYEISLDKKNRFVVRGVSSGATASK